jgi:hypothetical protein
MLFQVYGSQSGWQLLSVGSKDSSTVNDMVRLITFILPRTTSLTASPLALY